MNTEAKQSTFKVRFSTRGRVAIPIALRRKYALKGGSRAKIMSTPEGILIETVSRGRTQFQLVS
jgi:bifunctional DNA-binding transcriptional regulator/antitoxin component of YhaV-PrlF toxin-antitoxin module